MDNVPYYVKKFPTVSSGNYVMTETSNMHQLLSHTTLQSKYKESTSSSHYVASGSVWTEVNYYSIIYFKPTRD